MKLSHLGLALLVAGTSWLSACKKKEDATPAAPTEQVQQSQDNSDVRDEGDQLNSDVDEALKNYDDIRGGRVAANQVCGCQISRSGRVVTLTFDGTTPCGSPSRTRGGVVTVELVRGQRWSEQNAQLKITMQDYTVTRLNTDPAKVRSVKLNGTKYLTNVRGHNWLAVVTGADSVEQLETGRNLRAEFRNGATATYNMRRRVTWRIRPRSGAANTIYYRAQGDTAIGQDQGVDTWGTNRNGQSFVGILSPAWSSNTFCGLWRPTAGTNTYKAGGNMLTFQAGVNEQGNTDSRECAFGYKVSWTLQGGQSGTLVQGY